MNKKNNNINKLYHFPEKLILKLDEMEDHPLTIVEAPSGFGKTTAVKEYLKSHKNHKTQHWYTCLGEAPTKAWGGICDLISMIDDKAAVDLRRLDLPTVDTLADMAGIMRGIDCDAQTFLIIDNYQLLKSEVPRRMINAFSTHGNENLHIVIITQQLKEIYSSTVHHSNIYKIESSDLLFDSDNISSYFKKAGLRLEDKKLKALYSSTEGWVSAIRLQLMNYNTTGTFERTTDIEQLVSTAVWNLLTEHEKSFLLLLCVLDSFTTKQANIILENAALSTSTINLLSENSFIRYFPEKDIYTMHSILQDYLRNRFYNHLPDESKTWMLRIAGESCDCAGDYYAAAKFYYKIGDYESILSLPLDAVYLNNQKEKDVLSFITDVVSLCPDETLSRYPLASLAFAFHLYMGGRHEPYAKLCRIIEAVIEDKKLLTKAEFSRIKGEYAILKSFENYNDIQKMSVGHRVALECLDGPSLFMNPATPWTFGNVSVLSMYWRKVGELEKELEYMDKCMPIYSKLVKGHGVSADIVMRAEAMILRGEDQEAEALCHKALYLAKSENQIVLGICAELVLARIALLRGDADAYNLAIEGFDGYAISKTERFVHRAAELCSISLKLTREEIEGLPDWFYNLESMKNVLYILAMPYGHRLYGKMLLTEKRYSELYGLSGLMMGMADSMNYLLPKVYHLIYLSIAKNRQGRVSESQEDLLKALHLSLPDKIYMPFAEHAKELIPLLELTRVENLDKEEMDNLIALCIRQKAGTEAIARLLEPQKSVLTTREREIALLAKDGLSVRQIGDALFISENTVKSALRIIYNKLDIHSKVQLANLEI